MISKNLIVLGVILIVFLAAAASFYLDKNFMPSIWFDNTLIGINVQDEQITDSTKPFKINVTYPQIAGLDDFNQKAKAIIDKEISDFKKYSLENDEAIKKVDPVDYAKYPREYELDISYDKGQIGSNVASIMFNIYKFEGGAHGASYFVALNYNPKTKTEIKLADLFEVPPGSQSDYLQKISEFCTADLTKQMAIISEGKLDEFGTNWIKEGAGPKKENFTNFLINKNIITFYFEQYQVAPGAAGEFKVTMPR